MKRKFFTLTFVTLSLFLLSACQSTATVTTESTPPPVTVETASLMDETPSYPAPELYSSPPIEHTDFLLNMYPGPIKENASFVDWSTGEKAILAGEVAEIYQDNILHVTLILKSGDFLLTVQPSMDEVTKTLERCGDLCKDTIQLTE